MRINPVFKNELRLNTRTMKTAWMIFAFNAILVMVSIFSFSVMVDSARLGGGMNYRSMLVFYVIMAYTEFVMLVLIVPGLAAGSISGERERQTLEMLLTTKMSPWQIVIGKLEASLSNIMILSISSLPVLSLVFVYGGIQARDIVVLFVMLFVTAVFMGSIGIFYSSLLKKTTNATVLTYATELILLLGSFVLMKGIYFLMSARFEVRMGTEYPSVGGWLYLLLLNPVISFFELINRQTGNHRAILQMSSQFGVYQSSFVIDWWLYISLGIQICLSLLLLWGAAWMIDPLRKRK